MATGTPVFQDMSNSKILAYLYKRDKTTIWVVHNLGEKTVKLPLRNNGFNITKGEKMKEGDELVLGAYSSALVHMGK